MGIDGRAFRRSTYSTGPSTTCISRDSGLTGRSSAANRHATYSVWEFEPWLRWVDGTFLIGREAPTIIRCSFMTGSTWRSDCTLLGAVAIWEFIWFLPLPELEPKS